jgi:hypothetical protein
MIEIKQELEIRSENVQRIYEYYLDGRFLVNRRYQRKLVWTLEEKASFIDSIRQGFPLPIILVAEVTHDGKNKFEIIDGMQRLNTIISFIEGNFTLREEHFDLQTMAPSKLLLDTQKISQRNPILDREICTEIASYIFPISVYKVTEEEKIDEIFRRINSGGKQLCMQELRQAGKTSQFPQLVRKLSSAIRKDASIEKLDLGEMQKYSITSSKSSLGIYINEIFWVRQGVITYNNIRASKDEELISHLLAYMLFEDSPPPTSTALDHFYGFEVDDKHKWLKNTFDIENALKRKTSEVLERQFLRVFNEIKNVMKEGNSSFNRDIFGVTQKDNRRTGSNVNDHFHIIFLAFYELLIKNKNEITNYADLARELFNIANRGMTLKGNLNIEIRQQNIRVVQSIIAPKFTPKVANDPVLDDWRSQLEKIFSQSSTEQALYDFKIGFHNLNKLGEFNKDSLSKVVKTLAAMANYGIKSVGYIIVGVADSDDAANQFEKIYSTSPTSYSTAFRNFYITGVQDEIRKYHGSDDAYLRKITDLIKNEPTSDSLKNQISNEIRLISYHDKLVLILTVRALEEPCFYDNKMFVRHGSNVQELIGAEQGRIFKLFNS